MTIREASVPVPVITIDGASGTGKGTVGQLLAHHLQWHFLDSGALYRVLSLAAERHQVAFDNEAALTVLAAHLDVQFHARVGEAPEITLEGENVTNSIRTEKIGNAASIIGALPAVREALIQRQRAFCEAPGLVTDGRDMGTVIFPQADLKIFLTASAEERAKRRLNQLKQQGISVNLPDLVKEQRERDERDSQRAVAPLKPAHDAICINTDNLSASDALDNILAEIRRKKALSATSQLAKQAELELAE